MTNLRIEVCHPDPMPSDNETALGVAAAEAILKAGGSFEDAEWAALAVCFKAWSAWPESASLVAADTAGCPKLWPEG